MNGYREENQLPCCYFHPSQLLIGVCPLCLNERLLVLASKQHGRHHHLPTVKANHHSRKFSTIHLPKFFALSSFLNWHHPKSNKFHDIDDYPASTSHEDSFISIKIEDNGIASWDKSKNYTTKSWNQNSDKELLKPNKKSKTMSVIDHQQKFHSSLSWRKRVGQLFHLIEWKRFSNREGSKLEGVKTRKGWIKTALTKKRSKE